MATPTADWEKVGDKFYRKIQLYTEVFDQDLELDNYIVTGASYGGAICTRSRIVLLHCTDISKPYTETKQNSTPFAAARLQRQA
jgi:hypothetical protein